MIIYLHVHAHMRHIVDRSYTFIGHVWRMWRIARIEREHFALRASLCWSLPT